MNNGVTIIICTYNGAKLLGDTIAHIAAQQVPVHIKWEVILVDNASSDHSSIIGKMEWQKYDRPEVSFRIINEAKPGKIYALEHAIKEACYEYLIICDDDNWLAPDYLSRIYNIFESEGPELAAIGGFGIPVTSGIPLPNWFKDYEGFYAVGAQAKNDGFMPSRSILWGAGLGTKKSVYLEMYKTYPSFLTEHDVNILSTEDTEYCLRLLLRGYKLYYDSNLIYHHFIPDNKLDALQRDAYIEKLKNSSIILRKYYAAMSARIETKGRPDIWLMLLLVTPFKYLFSFSKRRAEKAKNTLFHLLPFGIKADAISMRIKAFINE